MLRLRRWESDDEVRPELMDALAERDEQMRAPRRLNRTGAVFRSEDEEPLTMSFPLPRKD